MPGSRANSPEVAPSSAPRRGRCDGLLGPHWGLSADLCPGLRFRGWACEWGFPRWTHGEGRVLGCVLSVVCSGKL